MAKSQIAEQLLVTKFFIFINRSARFYKSFASHRYFSPLQIIDCIKNRGLVTSFSHWDWEEFTPCLHLPPLLSARLIKISAQLILLVASYPGINSSQTKMEHMGAMSEVNWNFPDESEVIMAQLLGDHEAILGIDTSFCSDQSATSYSLLDNLISCWPGLQSYDVGNSNIVSTMDCFVSEEKMRGSSPMVSAEYHVEDHICSKDDENEPKEAAAVPDHNSDVKRKFLEPENGVPIERSKKKARVSAQVQKGAKNEEAMSNASCSSEDPQSLYARKRRERISERLKVLQNLVPNGTKVDISTMLEEAVQYVKFLQLQIKLLSSNDLWMYAPLAYNGMDIGLDLKIPLPQ